MLELRSIEVMLNDYTWKYENAEKFDRPMEKNILSLAWCGQYQVRDTRSFTVAY